MLGTLTYRDWDSNLSSLGVSAEDAMTLINALCMAYPPESRPVRVRQLICHLGRIEELTVVQQLEYRSLT